MNLDESLVCNPDLGCGLVAGYGLSGAASDRPGFGWFFGGDASINSFAMSGAGQSALVRDGALRFFAKYQRADGKITHEISQGAGHVDWFSYPYPYYHGDTTPFWILAFGEYWRQTGDTALVRELWPNLKRAFEWSRETDKNGDGLMENPVGRRRRARGGRPADRHPLRHLPERRVGRRARSLRAHGGGDGASRRWRTARGRSAPRRWRRSRRSCGCRRSASTRSRCCRTAR